MKKNTKTITVIISTGQYQTCADEIDVTYTSRRGLLRRLRELSTENSVYGDNWAGWLPARIAVSSPEDEWGNNTIIGGQWCDPANGWLDLDDPEEIMRQVEQQKI